MKLLDQAITKSGRRAMRAGRQRSLPLQPRFINELVTVAHEDQVIIDGADQLHVFEGNTAGPLLSAVIPLMNGRRTLEQIQLAMPEIPAPDVQAAVRSLFRWGLVEDGEADLAPGQTNNFETLAFLRRHIGATGANGSGREAYETLLASEVFIADSGDTPSGELLSSLLKQSGIGRVTALDWKKLRTWRPEPATTPGQSVVISISLHEEDSEWHAELDDWCFEHDFSWLRAAIDKGNSHADLGPLFSRERPCYRCFSRVYSGPASSQSVPAAELPCADRQFFVSLIAIEVIYLLSRIGPLLTGRDFQRYDLKEWLPRPLRWPRVVDCPRCRPLALSIGTTDAQSPAVMDTALVFEDYIALPPLGAPSKESEEQVRTNLALPHQTKRLSNCTQYGLNRPELKSQLRVLDALCSVAPPLQQSLSLDELATVLMVTGGLHTSPNSNNDEITRWAATGGNLGSVELFVAVRRVNGLPSGFYFYQPFEHSLASFQRRSGAIEIEEFMRRVIPGDSARLPDVLVVFTGAFHRVTRKYGAFGYRLINMDAGAALSQLHLVARSLGISSVTANRWADDLIGEQLNLEPLQEQSTAVAALYRGSDVQAGPAATNFRTSIAPTNRPSSAKDPRDFRDLSLDDVFQHLYHESRINQDQLLRGPFPFSAEELTPQHRAPAISLPAPARGGSLVSNILAERKSVRRYTIEPVSMQQLSTMLYCAHLGDTADWPQEHTDKQPLSFLVFAWRVAGLNPGVYKYDAEDHALGLCGPAPTPRQSRNLFLQPEFAAAPLVVWMAGDLGAACARHGAFGHRQLLLRAGAAGHRLWMAAMGMELSGVLVAGVVPGAARQFGLDGYRQASLLAFVTGHQASDLKPANVGAVARDDKTELISPQLRGNQESNGRR